MEDIELSESCALKMLEYATKTFENVDSSFFEGLCALSDRVGDFLLKKGYQIADANSKREKEMIEYWSLDEADARIAQKRKISNAPWKYERKKFQLDVYQLGEDSDYLPYGIDRRDTSKKLVWRSGWASIYSQRKRIQREFSIAKIPELVEDFYASISPMYGEMAHNELRNAKFTIPMEWYNDDDYNFNVIKNGTKSIHFSEQEANSLNISLTGTYKGAAIVAHELMHRFLTINQDTDSLEPKQIKELISYQNTEKTPSFLNHLILQETCSIYMEQLCDDYLKANFKNVDIISLYAEMRWAIFADMAHNKSASLYMADLDKWIKMSKTLTPVDKLSDEEKSQLMDFIKATPEGRDAYELPEKFTQDLLHRMVHAFGYMYATFLHEKTLKGELNAKDVIDKCSAAYLCEHSDEKKQIQLLQELGAPFIKNGKFVMDDEVVEELFNAVKSDINRRTARSKASKKYFKKEGRSSVLKLASLKTIIDKRKKKER